MTTKTKSLTLARRDARIAKSVAMEVAFLTTDVEHIEPSFAELAKKMYAHRVVVEASETFKIR